MLHDDFNVACRLLHQMAAHPELQSDYVPCYPFKYIEFFFVKFFSNHSFFIDQKSIIYVLVFMKDVGFVVVFYKFHLIVHLLQSFIWTGV